MKKIICLLLAAVLLLSLTACGQKNEEPEPTDSGLTGEFDGEWVELPIDTN